MSFCIRKTFEVLYIIGVLALTLIFSLGFTEIVFYILRNSELLQNVIILTLGIIMLVGAGYSFSELNNPFRPSNEKCLIVIVCYYLIGLGLMIFMSGLERFMDYFSDLELIKE